MAVSLYTPRNIFSVVTHYGATAAVAAGAILLGPPAWAVGAGVLLMGGLSFLTIKSQKNFLENNLVRHPDVSAVSPKLGEIAKELYEKTGLKSDDCPIYDFRADEAKMDKKKGVMNRLYKATFDAMGKTHNAAAMSLGKPIIMISQPLLKLLDDKEEKAVLAHEFAHAAAYHQYVGLPQRLLAGMVGVTNSFSVLAAMVAAGMDGIFLGIAASSAVKHLIEKIHGNRHLLKRPDSLMDLKERAEKRRLVKFKSTMGSLLGASVYTYFNPVYLAVYAGAKAMATINSVVTGTFSRSMEYQADRGSVELGADPLALVTSLRKMTIVQERSLKKAYGPNLPKAGFLTKAWKNATASHPTTAKRIGRLSDMARKQGVSEDTIQKAVSGPLDVPEIHDLPYNVISSMMRVS